MAPSLSSPIHLDLQRPPGLKRIVKPIVPVIPRALEKPPGGPFTGATSFSDGLDTEAGETSNAFDIPESAAHRWTGTRLRSTHVDHETVEPPSLSFQPTPVAHLEGNLGEA